MHRIGLVLIALVAILSLSFSGFPAAGAQDPASAPDFEFSPEPTDDPAVTASGYFIYRLEPGASEAGFVRLANPGDTPVTLELAAADATTAQTGSSAFPPPGVAPVGVGAWLQLARSSVTLDPGSVRRIRFRIEVPEDAAPGQYLAGITAYVPAEAATPAATPEATPGADQASATIHVQTRYVIGVQIDVPGEWTPALTIAGVELVEQPSGPVLGVRLRNDGDTFLTPAGSLTVTDAAGETVLDQEITMGTFITGTEVVYPVAWPPALPPGDYTVRVELRYGDDRTATYEGAVQVAASAGPVISIAEVTLEESRDSATDELQFVTIGITVENPGAPISGGRLTLAVTRDGELVEELVLGEALTFPQGTAQASQRYLPAEGWAPGTYTFTVTLDAVEPTTGNTTRLSEATATLTVADDA